MNKVYQLILPNLKGIVALGCTMAAAQGWVIPADAMGAVLTSFMVWLVPNRPAV